jgi:hypothetical protein
MRANTLVARVAGSYSARTGLYVIVLTIIRICV